jgi:coenzyme F420-reducing hydrogenase gamma subunit
MWVVHVGGSCRWFMWVVHVGGSCGWFMWVVHVKRRLNTIDDKEGATLVVIAGTTRGDKVIDVVIVTGSILQVKHNNIILKKLVQ